MKLETWIQLKFRISILFYDLVKYLFSGEFRMREVYNRKVTEKYFCNRDYWEEKLSKTFHTLSYLADDEHRFDFPLLSV